MNNSENSRPSRVGAPRQDFRLVPFAACALLGVWAGLGSTGGFAVGSALVVVAFAGLVPAQRACTRSVQYVLALAAILSGSIGVGMCHAELSHPPPIVEAAGRGERFEVTGTVSSRPSRRLAPWGEITCSADVRASRVDVDNNSYAFAHLEVLVLNIPCDSLIGQTVWLDGRALEGDLRSQAGVRITPSHIQILGQGTRSERAVRAIDVALREGLANLPAHAQGLIPGVALGDDSRVSEELSEAMRLTGLTHLIAVSGGHISILIAIVVALVGRRYAIATVGSSAVALMGLVVLVGPHPSVIRAIGMSAVVLAAMALGRGTGAMPALCLAIIGTSWAFPWIATGYGFWLSAAATAGIVTIGTPLAEYLGQLMPQALADALAIPLAAQLACIPVLMLFSEDGSIWAVLANAMVAPVVAPLTVAGLAGALIGPLYAPLAALMLIPGVMATWWIDRVARILAGAPGSGIPLAWAAGACLIMLIAAVMIRHPGVLLLCAIIGGGCALWLWWPNDRTTVPEDWQVVQCDVGQGSALVARSTSHTVMVDVGPEGKAAANCLTSAGIDHLDLLILSHSHSDHIGGLPGVLETASVEQVWLSPNSDPVENTEWLLNLLDAHGVAFQQVQAGDIFVEESDGSSLVEILWPIHPNNRQGQANAQSLALRINTAGGILVLSDLPASSQDLLVPEVEPVGTVIMAHHGSGDQSERLAKKANPAVTLISVGENSYGHPDPSALDLYSSSTILDTQRCGSIAIDHHGQLTSRCESGP